MTAIDEMTGGTTPQGRKAMDRLAADVEAYPHTEVEGAMPTSADAAAVAFGMLGRAMERPSPKDAQIAELTAQRDAMLEALRVTLDALEHHNRTTRVGYREAIEWAKGAIARAEGGTANA